MNAAWYKTPTETTIMENTVAVSGVPNRAEKKADIPHSVAVRISRSSMWNSSPT